MPYCWKGVNAKELPHCFLAGLPGWGAIIFVLALMLVSRPAWSTHQERISIKHESGIVVEELAHGTEGEKAGLQEGDTLLTWSRSNEAGEIQSPFNLTQIETEQAPLGTVKLEGLRGTEHQAWSLGPDNWGLTTRPNFSSETLGPYLEGRDLVRTGKPSEILKGTGLWRELSERYSGSQASSFPAWLCFHAAESLKDAKQWKEMDNAYQSAIQFAEKTNPVITAQLFQAWAKTNQLRNDWAGAEKHFQLAIEGFQSTGTGKFAMGASLDALGEISRQRGNLDKAEQYTREALEIERKFASESLPVAQSLHNLGNITYDRGDLTEAEKYYRQALEMRSRLAPESIALASSYTSLGIVAWQHGDLSKWDEYEHHALEIRTKRAPGSIYVAASLNNLGMIALARGDLTRAEQYYRQAFDLKQKLVPGSLSLVGNLINLGNVEGERGDLDEAEQYFRQALEIQQRLAPGTLNVAAILGNLGKLEQYRGNLDKAEQYYRQTFEIQQKASPGSLRTSISFNDLGEVAEGQGDLVRAAQYFHQSLAIKEKIAPESLNTATTLQGLGKVAQKSGDLAGAEKYYRRALALHEKLAPGSTVHAESLAALASVLRDQQQLDAAAQFYAQAVSALDKQTARLGGSEAVRSGFRSNHSDIYRDYIDLLLAQQKPERAFEVLEHSRARVLLEMLAAAHVDIHKGADPSLLEQERSLGISLAAESDRRLRLLEAKNSEKQVTLLSKEIEDLEKQYQAVEERLRLGSPGYAALTQPRPLTVSEIQQLLDDDTVLLEYVLGQKGSFVFAVASRSLGVYKLPEREKIESQAKYFYKMLTARNLSLPSETAASKQLRVTKSDAGFMDAASALSRMLIGPVTSDLNHKRLVVVSDGAVQYVPFAALPAIQKPGQRLSARSYVPLLAQHEIVELPSASVLSVLRAGQAGRRQPTKQVLILADPVFDADDIRVKSPLPRGNTAFNNKAEKISLSVVSQTSSPNSARLLTRSLADMDLNLDGSLHLPRLPFSRREAAAILALTPAGMGTAAVDFDANRGLAVSGEIAHYRVVHFATHALVDNAHPELSGLVLSLVDQHGTPQPGFLDLQDIYNLDLDADLVVLSACDTALGKQVDGEGMIGLTRGFMYAGARGVIGTLWKVEDFSTAKFMTAFYKAIEQDRMSPAQALRQAQLSLWKEKHWSAPYYWAAFALQGDWR
jgi:CHAT domain-containing protein/Tfp pilus assembly protein PilF